MKYNIETINKRKKVNKTIRYVIDILLIIIIYNLILVSLSCLNKIDEISIFGYSAYKITTDSMKPEINSGDVVIVKKLENNEEIKKGDVITFEKTSEVITHRVIELKYENNQTTYVTKGDNNNLEDSNTITNDNIKGKVVLTIRFLGSIVSLFENQIFFLILILIFLILIFYKISINEKKENRREKKRIEDEKRNNNDNNI